MADWKRLYVGTALVVGTSFGAACGDDAPIEMGDAGTGTTGASTADPDTDTDEDGGPTTDSGVEPGGCVGEGMVDGDGATGGSDPGDSMCGDNEICVVDECVALPFEVMEECESPVLPVREVVALPVTLSAVVGADVDDDGADEIWGYDSGAIRGYDLQANEVGSAEVESTVVQRMAPVRWEGASDSMIAVVPSPLAEGDSGHAVVHVWQGTEAMEIASSDPMPRTLPSEVVARDFDGDGTMEILVDFTFETTDLWSLSPEGTPTHVDALSGCLHPSIQPLPDGSGLGLACPRAQTVEYVDVSGDGLSVVATYDLPDNDGPRVFGTFLDADVELPLLAGSVVLSEFDSVAAIGLGSFDDVSLAFVDAYRGPVGARVYAVDLDGDGRDDAVLTGEDGSTVVHFAADGTPCQTTSTIVTSSALGDFDGDGRADVMQRRGEDYEIYSAP